MRAIMFFHPSHADLFKVKFHDHESAKRQCLLEKSCNHLDRRCYPCLGENGRLNFFEPTLEMIGFFRCSLVRLHLYSNSGTHFGDRFSRLRHYFDLLHFDSAHFAH